MKYILIFSIILISCSKQTIEQNQIPLPKGIDTLPSFVVRNSVRVYVLNDVPEGIKWCVNKAVENWDSLEVLDFEMVYNLSEATTIVSFGNLSGSEAIGVLPATYLAPGSDIIISNKSRLNQAQMINTVMHELGHTIGFHHIYSNVSVMNIDCIRRYWGGWNEFDLSLIKTYYK